MMAAGGDWRSYDRKFRQDREYNHCSWYTTQPDLKIQAYRPKTSQNCRPSRGYTRPQQHNQHNQNNQHMPKGYCWAFHKRELRCLNTRCTFNHNCYRCHKSHPAYMPCNYRTTVRPASHTSVSNQAVKGTTGVPQR